MPADFTLRQARYFIAAAELGTLAAAGSALHVSASAVSQAVADLERRLGASLFIRTPHRPLVLTTTGAAVIAEMRRLVSAADDIGDLAHHHAGEIGGRLRVGCFSTLAPQLVPGLVTSMREAFPRIRLDVEELDRRSLVASLHNGELEVGVLYEDEGLASTLDVEQLAAARPYVLISASHRLADRGSLHLRELVGEPMVMLDMPPSRELFESYLASSGMSPPLERITRSFETVRSLVARGHGWSMLFQRPTLDVSYEGMPLRCLAIEDAVEPAKIVAAWPRSVQLTRRADAFLRVCRHELDDRSSRTDAQEVSHGDSPVFGSTNDRSEHRTHA